MMESSGAESGIGEDRKGSGEDAPRDSLLEAARRRLLEERTAGGPWVGELSSSALSTATAVGALELLRRGGADAGPLVEGGLAWLRAHANPDGGFGDTVDSPSNLSTTTLAWAALGMFPRDRVFARAEAWLAERVGALDAPSIAAAIGRRYGEDRTFAVPILTFCALAGRFGEGRAAWRSIPRLPFELAALPRGWFPRLGLTVVSYALPALIAIGQAQHRRAPSRNPVARLVRAAAAGRTLRLLEAIQPASGGFLEAAPLTSFVAMSLAGSGLADHPTARRAARFLAETVRP
ncbi:MAG TPA: hypothetical protein VEJ18_02955, partial [Planctomycetota bacterium]|nr:hypothetical protein [Planctomycetota bacterium]